MFHSAAEENKPSSRPQNSPPASWCLFCNKFVPKNVSVDTFPPSQPACEWVPGTSTPVIAEKGDRTSAWFLETDLWAVWQDKCLARVGDRWAAVHARWGRDRDRSAEDSRGTKAFMPCLSNGVTGKAEPIPQRRTQQFPAQLRPLGCSQRRPRTRSPREGRARRCVFSSSTREDLVGKHHGWFRRLTMSPSTRKKKIQGLAWPPGPQSAGLRQVCQVAQDSRADGQGCTGLPSRYNH